MGSSDCDFVAKDETEDGVMQKMMTHATTDHPDAVATMKGQMSEEQMMAMMRSKVKDEM